MISTKFSRRSARVKASDIRELLKITEKPEIISFAGGMPAPEFFPVEQIKTVSRLVLEENGQNALQYSTTEGYLPLRQQIADLMKKNGILAQAEHILITSGSQQGLDLTGKVFIDEGDVIICEKPTYLAAINAFNGYMPEFREVEMDEEGMIIEDLEKCLEANPKAKFIYTIPDFQNPTGRTMSLERRKKLIETANRLDKIIIEDNPYGALRFEGETLPAIKHFDTEGRVIYLGTLSKILCPGFRIGWVYAQPEIFSKYVLFKQGTDLHTNTVSQMEASQFMAMYDIESHISKLRAVYKRRRDIMIEALKRELGDEVSFTQPKGGLFLWISLPEAIHSRELLRRCIEKQVAFVPGDSFFAKEAYHHTARLNFSNAREEEIHEGIKRMALVLKEMLATTVNPLEN